VILDLEMAADVARAAATDHLDDALNYKAVSDRLIQFVGEGCFNLVETLAEGVAAILRDEFGVRWLRLRVCKPGAIKEARDVGVVIERGKAD
jgi:dihydroneopterin aldolase